jgi:hypothetical protein
MRRDVFPVFDPVTGEFLFHKERDLVHADGDWHRGVHANIVRPNALGTFDILIQQRARGVDLGGGKFDQSLASQMIDEDGLDVGKTLQRGLLGELAVRPVRLEQLERDLRIIKSYAEHPGALNRELITLFCVVADSDGDDLTPVSPKVERVLWLEWSEFLRFFRARRHEFTKTSRFYFDDPVLLHEMTLMSLRLISPGTSDDPSTGILRLDHAGRAPLTLRGPLAECLKTASEPRCPNPAPASV